MFDFTRTYSQGTESWNKAPGSIIVAYNPIQLTVVTRTDDGGKSSPLLPNEQVELFGTRIREAVEVTRKFFKK